VRRYIRFLSFYDKRTNMDEKVKIVFDKEYKIRALDPVKFEKGEALEKECANFVEKISNFNEKVNTLVDVLDQHANRIDEQKLRVSEFVGNGPWLRSLIACVTVQAIGLRIAAEGEADQRIRQERALHTMINEKKAELDRYATVVIMCLSCVSRLDHSNCRRVAACLQVYIAVAVP
jgi:hypothetical protein